jgi:hypothetical protein
MRTWKDKLTSRKFWAAVVGVVISVMVIFGYSDEEKTKITGLIMATGTLIAYIVGEGITDKAHVNDSSSTELYAALLKSLASVPFTGNNANAEVVSEGLTDASHKDEK